MNNPSNLAEIQQKLEFQYISPLSKMHSTLEALKAHLHRQVITARIAEPETWLIKYAYDEIKHFDTKETMLKIEALANYLNADKSIFSKDYELTLHQSIPYFEWHTHKKLMAISDFIGQKNILYWLTQNELETDLELLQKNQDLCKKNNINLTILAENILIDDEKLIPFNVISITQEILLRLKLIKTSKGLKAVFSQGEKSTIELNHNGQVVLHTKFDLAKLYEHLQTTHQLSADDSNT